MADVAVPGWFVWHDLLTPNAAGAHEFYGKTLGWKKQAWDKDPSYLMFTARSGPIGGTMESRTATPHWLPYISTADVDATIEAACRLDARVLTPATPLPTGGRYAVLADPQGAPFGIHASREPEAAPKAEPQPGEFSWHELATNLPPNIAFAFYAALFDWDEISQTDMGPMGMYLIFGRNGRQLGGMFDKGAAGKQGPAYWLGYVRVTGLEGVIEKAKAARGSLLAGPMDVPGGDRIAQLMDPYGAFFALHKAAAASSVAGQPAPRESARPAAAKKKAPARKAPGKKGPTKRPPPKKRPAKRAKAAGGKKAPRKPAARKTAARTPAKTKAKAKAKAKAKTKARPKAKTAKKRRR
jgi:predicted enzyme related to lactoylglutathione lyase